jgi:hypothetical protein
MLYNPLPKYLVKGLQRVQYAAAGFVASKWISDVKELIKLGWLPVEERREWHLIKVAHKALYSDSWPNHLKLIRVSHSRTLRSLRSCSAPRLHIPLISNTLQDIASSSFNALPDDIRACCDYNQFCNMTKRYLMHRVMN